VKLPQEMGQTCGHFAGALHPGVIDHAAHVLRYTVFPNTSGQSLAQHTATWPDLFEMLRAPKEWRSKEAMPLIKLATFGGVRSPVWLDKDGKKHGDSLRHDANVIEITGIEGDYDGEKVTIAEAVARLQRYRIRALVYTSPRHTPEAPRWRVLAPLSAEYQPAQRAALLARLNGALGGILASESFTLSQTYFFGRVAGQAYECAATFDEPDEGTCIDELELDEIAIGRRGPAPGEAASPVDASGRRATHREQAAANVARLGRKLREGDGRREMLKSYIASRSARGFDRGELWALVENYAKAFFDPADPMDDENIQEVVKWAFNRDEARRRSGATLAAQLLAGQAEQPGQQNQPEGAQPAGQAADAAAGAGAPPAPTPQAFNLFAKFEAPSYDENDVPAELSAFPALQARAAGFDPSGAIVSAVIAAAAMIHDRITLEVSKASGWYERPCLWMLILAGPGAGKSPSIRAVTKRIQALHAELVTAWVSEHGRGKKVADDAPPRPALFTSDTTIEKMADILAANPRGILYENDEFETWVGSHDAYRAGGASRDTGEWCRLFDGGPKQIDRVLRGSSFVPNWSASVLSATTPATLEKLAKKLPADGLFQRFLLVSMRRAGKPDRKIDAIQVRRAREAFEMHLDAMHGFGGEGTVRMALDAAALFEQEADALRELTAATADVDEKFAGHVSKHAAMLARVALTFHCAQCYGAHPSTEPLTLATLQTAIRFMRKAYRHAFAIYGAVGGMSPAIELARAVGRRVLATKATVITNRDLIQSVHDWRKAEPYLRTQAAQFLVDVGWLRAQCEPGSTPTSWDVAANVHTQFADEAEREAQRRALVRERISESATERRSA
jgi:hypothetical protein